MGWIRHFCQSEMALFSECRLTRARNLLDTSDIVRDARLRRLHGRLGEAVVKIWVASYPFLPGDGVVGTFSISANRLMASRMI